jgi:diguanylate cyclase (GGDEF)-like protein
VDDGLTVGVLSPFVGGDYYGAVIAGITEEVAARGGKVVAIQTLDPGSRSADNAGLPAFDRPVAWRHVTGFVVVVGAVSGAYLERLAESGKPVVLVSHDRPGFAAVLPDNKNSVAAAVDHLVEHGHSRIGFVGHLGVPDIQERFQGYWTQLGRHGLEPVLFAGTDNHETGGEEAAAELLAQGDLPVTAIVAGTDRNALGVMRRVQAAGLKVPDDLALVGFDDIPATRYSSPSLSSIRQPLGTLGRTAVRLLLSGELTNERSGAAGTTFVPTHFVPRESCGCPFAAEGRPQTVEEFARVTRVQFDDITYLQTMLNAQYELGMDLLRSYEEDPRTLNWLRRTPVHGGCLGLWRNDTEPALRIVGGFRRDRSTGLPVDGLLAASAFPPKELFELSDEAAGDIVFVVPVRSTARDWGMLATVGAIQSRTPPGREIMNESGALLAVALDHESLLASLREQEERLRHAALYDQLTGLPNRSLFNDRLTQAIRRAQRQPDSDYAVLFLDLDGFKAVNDTFGHAAGDELLVQVAGRIRAELRAADTAARFGGDEFLVLLDGMAEDKLLARVATRLHTALATPFHLRTGVAEISASIGVASSTGGYDNAEDVLRDADAAMYRAKHSGLATTPG